MKLCNSSNNYQQLIIRAVQEMTNLWHLVLSQILIITGRAEALLIWKQVLLRFLDSLVFVLLIACKHRNRKSNLFCSPSLAHPKHKDRQPIREILYRLHYTLFWPIVWNIWAIYQQNYQSNKMTKINIILFKIQTKAYILEQMCLEIEIINRNFSRELSNIFITIFLKQTIEISLKKSFLLKTYNPLKK